MNHTLKAEPGAFGMTNTADEGKTTVTICASHLPKKRVIIEFPQPLRWIGFNYDDAVAFASAVLREAETLRMIVSTPSSDSKLN